MCVYMLICIIYICVCACMYTEYIYIYILYMFIYVVASSQVSHMYLCFILLLTHKSCFLAAIERTKEI